MISRIEIMSSRQLLCSAPAIMVGEGQLWFMCAFEDTIFTFILYFIDPSPLKFYFSSFSHTLSRISLIIPSLKWTQAPTSPPQQSHWWNQARKERKGTGGEFGEWLSFKKVGDKTSIINLRGKHFTSTFNWMKD